MAPPSLHSHVRHLRRLFPTPARPLRPCLGNSPSNLSPLPRGGQPIIPEHAARLTEAARWGGGRIRGLLYSPDGSILALLTALGTYLHDAGTLEPLRRIETAHDTRDAAFSPDGSILALTLANHTIELRSVPDGALLRTLHGQRYIDNLAFAPDGARIFSSGMDDESQDTVSVWSVADGALIRAIPVPQATASADLTDSAFHPDGEHVATTSTDGTLRILRLADGSEMRATGKPFLLNPYHFIAYIDSGFRYHTVAFSPDGSLIAASDSQSFIYIWNFHDGRLVRALTADASVDSLTFASNTLLFTGSGQLIDLSILRRDREFDLAAFEPGAIAIHPDGDRVGVSGGQDTVGIWRLSDGAFLKGLSPSPGLALPYDALLLSPDDQTLFAGDDLGNVQVRRLPGGELLRALPHGDEQVTSLAVSPDGALLAGATWLTQTLGPPGVRVRVWRLSDGALLYELPGHQWIEDLAFSPDGRLLATVGADPTGPDRPYPIRLWNMADGRLVHELHSHEFTVDRVAFIDGGSRLLTASRDDTLRLWDTANGALLETRAGFRYDDHAAFSPDGALLAARVTDDTVAIFRAVDNSPLHRLVHENDRIWSVAFSPDGALLATGSESGTLRLWHVADGALLLTLPAHANILTDIAFSPAGDLIVTAGWDATLRFWRVPPP